MRTFFCRNCGQLILFESSVCLRCRAQLGFAWADRDLLTLKPSANGLEPLPVSAPDGEGALLHRCANAQLAACNWLVADAGELCRSCGLTRTRPGDDDALGIEDLQTAEAAKRRLLFELGELGLAALADPGPDSGGLSFDLLSSAHEPVTTGHDDGHITLDLAEVDDARRLARREQLGEAYRTVLGHLRHEIGHYYWPLLVDDAKLERSRELFGDESADYQAALDRHYDQGPPLAWRERHVSAYATMHPSEDWAETFAHYLHVRDTMQTAVAYRVRVLGPELSTSRLSHNDLSSNPSLDMHDFAAVLSEWLPLTYAINALNRSMGGSDLYPFVLPEPVIEKLVFIHGLVERNAASNPDRSSQDRSRVDA